MTSENANSTAPQPPTRRLNNSTVIFLVLMSAAMMLALVLTIASGSQPSPPATQSVAAAPPPAPARVPDEVMKELSMEVARPPAYAPQEFATVAVLVHHMPADTAAVAAVARKIHHYYSQQDARLCLLKLWDDENAYELYQYKQQAFRGADPETMAAERRWKRKNWKAVCEHFVCGVDAFSPAEPWYYPFIDMQYREYGGRKTFNKN